jgi:cell division protein FtsB
MDLRVKQASSRRFPGTDEGLRMLVERAPQAEAFADRVMEKLRPALAWLYDARRRIATAGVALLTVWLFLHVMFGANGMVVYRQKRAEYQNLQKEIAVLQKENDQYASQVKALQTDPKMIEKEAREQWHYVRPGEVVLISPAPLPRPTPVTNSAHK